MANVSQFDSVFCSPFDERLANTGPPAVFLRDPEGRMRFDADWTRDAYGRTSPGGARWRWALVRDRDSGYVQIVLVTGPELLDGHPRLDVRWFDDPEPALAALRSLGMPPITGAPW